MLSSFQRNKIRFNTQKKFPISHRREKPSYPIIDLYERITGNTVKKRYTRYVLVLCPFHGEQKPSLGLYSETNSYYCFSCGVSGDIYKMVMELENKTFTEALEYIRSL